MRLLLTSAAILLFGCSFAQGPRIESPASIREEPNLKVAVLTNVPRAAVSAEGAFHLAAADDAGPAFAARTDLVCRAVKEGIEVVGPDGGVRWLGAGPVQLVPDGDAPVVVEGSRFPGSLLVVRTAEGRLNVLNDVSLEAYVEGVVPNEIPHKDPALLEAVKAQAVAARTYALAYRGRYDQLGYDLLNTVADQVYTGLENQDAESDEAVRQTRGVVALYDGQPIETNYCSTCGGHTAGRDEVWDKPPLPYLRGVSDRGGDGFFCSTSKYFNWEEEWGGEEFWSIVRAGLARDQAIEIPAEARLEDIHIIDRGGSGRVRTLRFITSRGDYEAHGDRIRWIVQRPDGQGPLRSTLFDVWLESHHGLVTRVRIRGHGWGHGVGMCQWGAMERSRRGIDYAGILTHYYRGVRLEEVY